MREILDEDIRILIQEISSSEDVHHICMTT